MSRSPPDRESDAPPDARSLPRAKHIQLPLRTQPPELVPARMVNEFVYCPRLFFYEWVEGVFAHSSDTVEGALRHEKLERKEDALPPAADAGEQEIHSRSVELSSETYKVIAKIDLVEGECGTVTPIDYKKGAPREGADGPATNPARAVDGRSVITMARSATRELVRDVVMVARPERKPSGRLVMSHTVPIRSRPAGDRTAILRASDPGTWPRRESAVGKPSWEGIRTATWSSRIHGSPDGTP